MRRATLIGALAVALAARAEAQPRWRLVEELRIGGADSGAASLNDVRDIALGARGQIYVFDYQAQEIRLFDAGGKFVRLVGRKGAGPGEFTQPNGIRTAPDGSLWVNDHSNARFMEHRLSWTGTALRRPLPRGGVRRLTAHPATDLIWPRAPRTPIV